MTDSKRLTGPQVDQKVQKQLFTLVSKEIGRRRLFSDDLIRIKGKVAVDPALQPGQVRYKLWQKEEPNKSKATNALHKAIRMVDFDEENNWVMMILVNVSANIGQNFIDHSVPLASAMAKEAKSIINKGDGSLVREVVEVTVRINASTNDEEDDINIGDTAEFQL